MKFYTIINAHVGVFNMILTCCSMHRTSNPTTPSTNGNVRVGFITDKNTIHNSSSPFPFGTQAPIYFIRCTICIQTFLKVTLYPVYNCCLFRLCVSYKPHLKFLNHNTEHKLYLFLLLHIYLSY